MNTGRSTTDFAGSMILGSLWQGDEGSALWIGAVQSVCARKLQLCSTISGQLLDRKLRFDKRYIDELSVTFWWEKRFVLDKAQEEFLEAKLAIDIFASQTYGMMRVGRLPTDGTFDFKLGQLLEDSSLTVSILS